MMGPTEPYERASLRGELSFVDAADLRLAAPAQDDRFIKITEQRDQGSTERRIQGAVRRSITKSTEWITLERIPA
jgi:hypothetical protein